MSKIAFKRLVASAAITFTAVMTPAAYYAITVPESHHISAMADTAASGASGTTGPGGIGWD